MGIGADDLTKINSSPRAVPVRIWWRIAPSGAKAMLIIGAAVLTVFAVGLTVLSGWSLWKYGPGGRLLLCVLLGLPFLLVVWGGWSWRRRISLLRSGHVAPVHRVTCRPGYATRFQFYLPDGRLARGETDEDLTQSYGRSGDFQPDDLVIYHPSSPARAVLIRSLSPRLMLSPAGDWELKHSPPQPKSAAPYGVGQRPWPRGADARALSPSHVGPFTRELLEDASDAQRGESSVVASYSRARGDAGESIRLEVSVCESEAEARAAIETAMDEAASPPGALGPTMRDASDNEIDSARGQEPSFLRCIGARGAWFTWTRGRYLFSVFAPGGESDLDAFMAEFPY